MQGQTCGVLQISGRCLLLSGHLLRYFILFVYLFFEDVYLILKYCQDPTLYSLRTAKEDVYFLISAALFQLFRALFLHKK